MIKELLISEFLQEAENTRKVLEAIPDSALGWKSSEKTWSTAELASHVATIYAWYPEVLLSDSFELSDFKYERENHSASENILKKFEENFALAKEAFEKLDENKLNKPWTMTMKEKVLIPPTPKYNIIRTTLFNHLYHHRGELIVYLRATGNKVPGFYGPTADDKF